MAVRERYLDYEAITAELERWETVYPSLVRRRSLGTTPEGREIWCATIGLEPDRHRPALFVNAGQHAAELSGTNVALALGRAVLGLLSRPDDPSVPTYGLPRSCLPDLARSLLHIVPRVSPDGAQRVLRGGWAVRSVPRAKRFGRPPTRWLSQDVDGDGQIQMIRRLDPSGEYVESKLVPGLLVARTLGDEGPFYKLWPEGLIEGFDGANVPSPRYLEDNYPDLNRNYPYDWRPETEQPGAGDYPTSEPESRALVEFATAHPQLFGWIDYHTFGGVFIRPLGTAPDTKLDPSDLALYRQIGAWASELTGYPMVSGYEQFTYEPDTPLRGDLTEYAYHQRATVAFVVELWDLFERAGLPQHKRFVDRYTHIDRPEMEKIALWANENSDTPWLLPWRPFEHPQLGAVEVGGIDRRFVIVNPPPKFLAELCDRHIGVALRLMACAPILELCDVHIERKGDSLRQVELTVRNRGYLPTHVVAPGKNASHADPITITASGVGCVVITPQGPVTVASLDGWGRGLYGGGVFSDYSSGTTSMIRIRYAIEGSGTLSIRAGNSRMDHQTLDIEVP